MTLEGRPLTEEEIKEVEKAFELIDESINGLFGGEKDEQKLPKNTNSKRQRKAQTVLQKTSK